MRQLACLSLILVSGVTLFAPGIAQAGMYTFEPTPADLWDLSHWRYYTWGIEWMIPEGERISFATLSIDNIKSIGNINNWRVARDILYIHLLDDPPPGARKAGRDVLERDDAFEGTGLLLTTYTDDDQWPHPPRDFSYEFEVGEIDVLQDYVANGVFGFGFDPDGHYFNDGVSLTIETQPYPEPCTMMLTVIGLGFVGRTRLRRRLGR